MNELKSLIRRQSVRPTEDEIPNRVVDENYWMKFIIGSTISIFSPFDTPNAGKFPSESESFGLPEH